MFILPLIVSGQLNESEKLVLGVTKIGDSENITYTFKEGGYLKIKTIDGGLFYSSHYNLYDDFIVFNQSDTILFEDIQMIRGSVYENKGRRILGTVIFMYGLGGGFVGTIMLQALKGGAWGLAVAVPFTAISIAGRSLMGARKFKSDKWQVVAVPANGNEINGLLLPEEALSLSDN